MANHAALIREVFPMSRPKILVRTAWIGARHYHRTRDLPGAAPGLLTQPVERIIPRLVEVEAHCEENRRAGSAAYRPALHVQILAALLAESRTGPRSA